jgi:hypothetical protein
VLSGIVGDKYTWRVQGTPYVLPKVKSDIVVPAPEALAFNVQVSVTWQEGPDEKEVVLNSVRLAKPAL